MMDEKVNILMVDDQPSKLLTYEVILAELGENLIKANSASEAMGILLKTDIAVILMDVSMPDIDGFQLADTIRQHPRFWKTAIIFISGVHLTDSDRIQGYGRGAVDYISVPVIPELLRAKVGVFADLHRKTRMLESLNRDLEQRVEQRTLDLRESEAQFRMRAQLLDIASEAIIVRDMNGAIQFWNSGAEDLYGWRRDEVMGCEIHALLQTIFPVSRTEINHALLEQKAWQGRLVQRSKSGKEIVVACRKTVNHEGNAVLEVIRDITAELRAEEALRETEKLAAMGRVAGIIAHEINNPLEAITNLFYLLRRDPSLGKDAQSYAEMAEQELQRVSHITRQTLSFYRESKQPIQILVAELLDEVLDLHRRSLDANRITIRREYSREATLMGFPVELRQVFLNLIGNAIQAMPKGGTLGVLVRSDTDWTREARGTTISILDTGDGIQPEDAPLLFQPFFSTKSTKGTGLGLWISKGIIQKYNGRISFRSLRGRAGCVTSFRVFFPVTGSLDRELSEGSEETRSKNKTAATAFDPILQV